MEKTGPERLQEFLQNATEEELAEVRAAAAEGKGVGPTVKEYFESFEMQNVIKKFDELTSSLTDEKFDAMWDAVQSKGCTGPRAEDFLRAHEEAQAARDLVETCQRMVLRGYSGNDIPVDTSRISWGWDHPDIKEIRRCLEAMGAMPLPVKELEDKILGGPDGKDSQTSEE